MHKEQPTTSVKFILAMVFLSGFGLCICMFFIMHTEFWIFSIRPPQAGKTPVNQEELTGFVAQAKKSILLVFAVDCDNKPCGYGTGFILKPGYVATNAHVARCGSKCDRFLLKDHKGMEHVAKIEGISSGQGTAEDLAILRIADTSLPPLALADSSDYEVRQADQVFTVGYPLVGIASSVDMASMSNVGRISQFSNEHDMFIANGMNPNSGNSGGPVFLAGANKVLGLVVSNVRGDVKGVGNVQGVEYVIPINRMKNFFQMKVGGDI